MSQANFVCIVLLFATTSFCAAFDSARAENAPEPGPENGGLRLRFRVTPRPGQGGQAGFDVQLDVLNVSQQNIRLQTAWESNDAGDVPEYLQAIAELETMPVFAPEHGATGAMEARTEPQRTYDLKAGESLPLRWNASGRRLKNTSGERAVSILGSNPQFEEPGLYSVRALLDVPTASGTVRLRSNEQLVSIGGSLRAPKPTAARIENVARNGQTARIDLGELDQVATGDQFEFLSKTSSWRITITESHRHSSEGTLELISSELGSDPPAIGEFVTRIRKTVAAK